MAACSCPAGGTMGLGLSLLRLGEPRERTVTGAARRRNAGHGASGNRFSVFYFFFFPFFPRLFSDWWIGRSQSQVPAWLVSPERGWPHVPNVPTHRSTTKLRKECQKNTRRKNGGEKKKGGKQAPSWSARSETGGGTPPKKAPKLACCRRCDPPLLAASGPGLGNKHSATASLETGRVGEFDAGRLQRRR